MLSRLLLPQEIWHRNRRKVLEKMYRQSAVRENMLNLDVGCGNSFALGKMFHLETFGIDVDKSISTYIREKLVAFLVADAHFLPFQDSTFDMITCLNILEFSSNPKMVLKEIHRVAKKEGVFLCLQPADCLLLRFLWFFWVRTFGRRWTRWRIRRFDRSRLLSLIEETFVLESVHFTNLGMLVGFVCRKT